MAARRPDDVAAPAAIPPRQVVAMPVVSRPTIDERRVNDRPPTITEHQQALLAQRGYQVDRRRGVVTGTLPDGRRVTMPIEQIRLRYQGNESL
jgi:hypothetical protein